ncbi:MAG: hypothetical protein ACYS9X_10270 [Planctomycetota bacterium]
MRAANLILGAIGTVAASLCYVTFFADPFGWAVEPERCNLVLVIMFLVIIVPFGKVAIDTSRIGLNVDEGATKREMRVFRRRLREAWCIIPFSGTLVVVAFLLPILLVVAGYRDSRLLFAGLAIFAVIPAVFYLRFMPNAQALISKWNRE